MARQDGRPRRLSMAKPTSAVTIARAAEILGCDEELLWSITEQLDPEDGVLWIYDVGDEETIAFTDVGLTNLREILRDQFPNVAVT